MLEAEAARLRDARIGAIEDRVEADLASGRHDVVVSELEGLVAAHPLRERLWRHWVLALYRCGRQADALRACDAVRRRLVGELGVDPGPELRLLEAAVLAESPDLAWIEAQPPAIPTAPAIALLERTSQLSVLTNAALAVDRDGRGRTVFVSGEAGVGKTALVRNFAADCGAARVWWGACDALFTPSPLGPLVEMAATVGGAFEATISGAGKPLDVAMALLRALQQSPRTLVVIEDLHSADEATLDVVRLLRAASTECPHSWSPRTATTSSIAAIPFEPSSVICRPGRP